MMTYSHSYFVRKSRYIAFLIQKRYISDTEQLNRQRFKCAAQMREPLYIWLAIDRTNREIIGCYLGDRSRESAKKLWKSLPGVYRQCAVAYTDFWESYKTVISRKRHRAVGKETGQTNPIERLNNTFRQRISRLVRESLSFSKKMENHVGEPFGILSMTTMHSKAKD